MNTLCMTIRIFNGVWENHQRSYYELCCNVDDATSRHEAALDEPKVKDNALT